ncbi:MAG: GDSL-type esterase/lipase family protein [Terrimicrobiaceae bacterium]
MKTPALLAALLLTPLALFSQQSPPEGRDTLGRFFEKAKSQKPVTVAFLGGSITEGAGATNPAKSWRGLTSQWLRKQYPVAQWTFLNAAIGGTGSDLGVYRVRQEILDRAAPDLVFVEFAVNDQWGSDRSKIAAQMEGIVRQIRTANPRANVVFVYTISRQILDGYLQGNPRLSTAVHKEVAAHYKLPEIDLQAGILDSVKKGEHVWEDYWMDTAHPNDRGHARYAEQVTGFLEAQSALPPAPAPELPPALVSSSLEHARLQPIPAKNAEGWSEVPPMEPFRSPRVQHIVETTTVGGTLDTEFEGPSVGVYFECGPDTGLFEVTVDDLPPMKIATFDPKIPFRRLNCRILKSDLPPGKHRLRIVNCEPQAGSSGSVVRLGGLLVLAP